jgi:hypothetical protein
LMWLDHQIRSGRLSVHLPLELSTGIEKPELIFRCYL